MAKKKKNDLIIWLISIVLRPLTASTASPIGPQTNKSSWSLLGTKTRYFMSKKKLFLLKKIPESWNELLYKRTPATRRAGYITRRSAVQWLADKNLNEGWLRRLSDQTNNYFIRLRRRFLTYRFKKQFKGLNKYNRLAIRKLFFPKLSKGQLTKFFFMTKTTPKVQLALYLGQVANRIQNPLMWLISHETLAYYKYWWHAYDLVKDAITAVRSSKTRNQLPLSTSIIQHMNYAWNMQNRTYSHNRTDFLGYKQWKESFAQWEKPETHNFLSVEANQNELDGAKHYYTKSKKVKWFWNTKITPHSGNLPTSAPVSKRLPGRSLEDGFMYDYRTLHQVQITEKLIYPQLAQKVPDLNLFNFRSFNWQIIT